MNNGPYVQIVSSGDGIELTLFQAVELKNIMIDNVHL